MCQALYQTLHIHHLISFNNLMKLYTIILFYRQEMEVFTLFVDILKAIELYIFGLWMLLQHFLYYLFISMKNTEFLLDILSSLGMTKWCRSLSKFIFF